MSEEVINSDNKVETVDSDKSFESCVNEVVESVCKLDVKDDDSEKSYVSCDDDKVETSDTPKIEPTIISNVVEEEDEDDDIRPGSCREVPSSEDEISSWDDNNDHWIYDDEYLQEAVNLIETITKPEEIPAAVDIQQTTNKEASPERKVKKEREFRKKQNPTYTPTSGQFFMHDIRSSEASRPPPRKQRQPRPKGKPQDSWRHDLYDEVAQKPLSRTELASKYGSNGGTARPKRQQKQGQSRRNSRMAPSNQYYDYEYEYEYDDYQHQQQQYWYRYPHGYYDDREGMYYDSNDYYYEPGYYEADPPRARNRPHHQQAGARDQRRQRSAASHPPANHNGHHQQQQQHQYGQPKEARQKKPPSKYSQISELTEIRITVDRDKLGERQIHSTTTPSTAAPNGTAVTKATPVVPPNNGRGDGQASSGTPAGRTEPSVPNDDPRQTRYNRRHNNSGSNNAGSGPRRPGATGPPPRNRAPPPPSPGQSAGAAQVGAATGPLAKTPTTTPMPGNIHRGNQHRATRAIPEWADSKYEWGDCGGDTPHQQQQGEPDRDRDASFRDKPGGPLRGGAVTNAVSSAPPPPQPQPPRFSRGAHAPRRYSEMRIADSAALVSSPDPALLGYRHHQGCMEQLYGGLAPVLLNLGPSQGPSSSSPSLVKPQQHPQLMSLLQSGCYGNSAQQHHPGPGPDMYSNAATAVGGVGSSAQYFLQQFYLPPGTAAVPGSLPSQPPLSSSSRLNQFSPPFQPSFLAAGAGATSSPLPGGPGPHASSVAPGTGTSTARPVLGRS